MIPCDLYFSNKSGQLATNDIDTYVPMDQVGEQHSTLASDAIREEEIEASNSEGQKPVTDVFKHPTALV